MDDSEIVLCMKDGIRAERFFRKRGLLRDSATCGRCGSDMKLVTNTEMDAIDSEVFECSLNVCKTLMSIRENSYFMRYQSPLNEILYAIYSWSKRQKKWNRPEGIVMNDYTLSNWRIRLRDIVRRKYYNTLYDKIGGPNTTIHIDTSIEIRITRKSKETLKLVGGYQLDKNEFQYFADFVSVFDLDSICNVIFNRIKIGTKLVLEFDNFNSELTNKGYMVEHFRPFSDPKWSDSNDVNQAKSMCQKLKKALLLKKPYSRVLFEEAIPSELFLICSSDPFEEILDLIPTGK